MSTNYIESRPLIVPRTYWNKISVLSMIDYKFKAISQFDWLLYRLGIHPIEIDSMTFDAKYFMISEFYCLDAAIQWQLLYLEEYANFDGMITLLKEYAIDPLNKKIA